MVSTQKQRRDIARGWITSRDGPLFVYLRMNKVHDRRNEAEVRDVVESMIVKLEQEERVAAEDTTSIVSMQTNGSGGRQGDEGAAGDGGDGAGDGGSGRGATRPPSETSAGSNGTEHTDKRSAPADAPDEPDETNETNDSLYKMMAAMQLGPAALPDDMISHPADLSDADAVSLAVVAKEAAAAALRHPFYCADWRERLGANDPPCFADEVAERIRALMGTPGYGSGGTGIRYAWSDSTDFDMPMRLTRLPEDCFTAVALPEPSMPM